MHYVWVREKKDLLYMEAQREGCRSHMGTAANEHVQESGGYGSQHQLILIGNSNQSWVKYNFQYSLSQIQG